MRFSDVYVFVCFVYELYNACMCMVSVSCMLRHLQSNEVGFIVCEFAVPLF